MESWERWVPCEHLPSTNFYLEGLFYDGYGLILEFSDENDEQIIKLHFERVLSYRYTEESSFLKTLYYLDQNYDINFYANWSFFKVTSSAYLNWLKSESCGIHNSEIIEHFVFFTPDDVIEVLSKYPPNINVINNTNKRCT